MLKQAAASNRKLACRTSKLSVRTTNGKRAFSRRQLLATRRNPSPTAERGLPLPNALDFSSNANFLRSHGLTKAAGAVAGWLAGWLDYRGVLDACVESLADAERGIGGSRKQEPESAESAGRD
ncbi:uncharacterized protein LOC143209766 [Lasioglossum baleicum]|uniref:uncharacterized protein LOC143209766 n=1 Tax=Lasioglossum baleicum TaxID=434251 RepID=UPI003FCE9DA8